MFTDSEPINDHVSACYGGARLIRFEPEVVQVSTDLNPITRASKLLHRGSRYWAEIRMLSYLETQGNTREDDLRSVETYFCTKKGRVLLATSIVMLATGFLSSID